MTEKATSARAADQGIADRLAILDLTARLGVLVDAREWAAVERLFSNPVRIDSTSLNGGEPQVTDPAEVVDGWRQVLGDLQATRHLIAGQVITLDGDHAAAIANVQATHVLPNASGGPIWTLGGRDDYRLTRTGGAWRISGLTLTVAWATGNQHIMRLASGGA